MRTLDAALRGGASNLTLCDTNGGTMVENSGRSWPCGKGVRGGKSGRALPQRCGLAVALSLAGGISAPSLVQGTVNGYGERTGNANR